MQPDPEPQLPTELGGARPDAVELLGDRRRRLTPGQVHVGLGRRHLNRRRRRPAEIQVRPHRRRDDLGIGELIVLAVEIDRLAVPQRPDDRQELPGAGVAILLTEVVAEPPLLAVIAAGDDVEQQPPTRHPLKRRRHLRRQRRRGEPGPERDQEPEPLGHLRQRRGHHPRVLAPAAGRRQRGIEAELLGGPGDLTDVADIRRPVTAAIGPAAADTDRITEAEIRPGVPVSRQEPMQRDGHGVRPCGRRASGR